jgi:hypothetical protein
MLGIAESVSRNVGRQLKLLELLWCSDGMKQRLFRGLVMMVAGLAFWMLYTMIHETGHILALKAFGAWRNGGALLLPLPGQNPHVSGDPSAHLEHWQIAVAAISGGLLPTLVGYLSFAFWASPFGNRHRLQGLWIERMWSLFTIMMLFPQAVPAPMLFPKAIHDTDYSLFIQNVGPSAWLANTGTALIALINLTLVVWVAKSLLLRSRAAAKTLHATAAAPGS